MYQLIPSPPISASPPPPPPPLPPSPSTPLPPPPGILYVGHLTTWLSPWVGHLLGKALRVEHFTRRVDGGTFHIRLLKRCLHVKVYVLGVYRAAKKALRRISPKKIAGQCHKLLN